MSALPDLPIAHVVVTGAEEGGAVVGSIWLARPHRWGARRPHRQRVFRSPLGGGDSLTVGVAFILGSHGRRGMGGATMVAGACRKGTVVVGCGSICPVQPRRRRRRP